METEPPAVLEHMNLSQKNFCIFAVFLHQFFALSLFETFMLFQLIPCQSTYCHELAGGTI